MIVYNKNGIVIYKRHVFGQTFLAGYNEKNQATATAVLKSDTDLPKKINDLIKELEKQVKINLSDYMAKTETLLLKHWK